MPKYIDPVSDFGFKHLFGVETNKDLLISLLNELFQEYKRISDLFYERNERSGTHEETGTVIFDLVCVGEDGSRFIIEVQRSSHANLKRRMLYYGSKIITEQAPRGKRSAWGYAIDEIYVIVLMDGFSLPVDRSGYESGDDLHPVWLCNRNTGDLFYEGLGFIYVELAKFVKEETELSTDLDCWLFVLKNMAGMDRLSAYLRKPVFSKLFDLAEYGKLSMEEKDMYDRSMRNKWDANMFKQEAVAFENKVSAFEKKEVAFEKETAAFEKEIAAFEKETAAFEKKTSEFEKTKALNELESARNRKALADKDLELAGKEKEFAEKERELDLQNKLWGERFSEMERRTKELEQKLAEAQKKTK